MWKAIIPSVGWAGPHEATNWDGPGNLPILEIRLPTAEIIFLLLIGLVILSLLAIFRRERRRAATRSGEPPQTMSIYKALAVLIILFAAYLIVQAILTAIARPGGQTY